MSIQAPTAIPMLDLTPEIEELWDELNAAFQRVLRSGQFILGPEVDAFEREVADYLGTKHAIGVNSGTDALVISLRALGIGPGDEVITTPFSFFATAESIGNVGATPVFVDIDERTFNIDPTLIEPAITSRTKAIMPVHLYGRPCEMDAIMDIAERHGLKLVEDCAQSFGARYQGRQTGTFGDAGAFSFFPTKNLGGFGDGGLIATNDDTIADLARMLRAHGSKKKYHHEMLGYNSRLDAVQAALLRVKLPHVDRWNACRRGVAHGYNALLSTNVHLDLPDVVSGHCVHQFTVRAIGVGRERFIDALDSCAIASAVHYPQPLNLAPALGVTSEIGRRSRIVSSQVFSLPVSTTLSTQAQERIAEALAEVTADQADALREPGRE